jgi:hypothetical protein
MLGNFPTQNFHIQYAQSLLQLKCLTDLTIYAKFIKWKNYSSLWRETISCVCLRLSQATDINGMSCVLHVTSLDLEEGGSMLPLKVGNCLPIDTLSYSSGLFFIILLWEPQILQFVLIKCCCFSSILNCILLTSYMYRLYEAYWKGSKLTTRTDNGN